LTIISAVAKERSTTTNEYFTCHWKTKSTM